ncbi:hypothetical protein [Vulcanisaeta distributa]|nr:hypothetical protein [Vulcanisaeta distributa]
MESAGSQRIAINEQNIIGATCTALNELTDYVKKQGINVTRVWPQR